MLTELSWLNQLREQQNTPLRPTSRILPLVQQPTTHSPPAQLPAGGNLRLPSKYVTYGLETLVMTGEQQETGHKVKFRQQLMMMYILLPV